MSFKRDIAEGYERPFSRRGFNLDDDDDMKTYNVDSWSPRSYADLEIDLQTKNPGTSHSVLTTSLSFPGSKRGKTDCMRTVKDKKYFHDKLLKKMVQIRGEIGTMKESIRTTLNGQTKYDKLAKDTARDLTHGQGILADYNTLNEWLMTNSDPTIQTLKTEIKQLAINNKDEEDSQETIFNAKINLEKSIKSIQEKIQEEKSKRECVVMVQSNKDFQEKFNELKNKNDKFEMERKKIEKEIGSLISPDLINVNKANFQRNVSLTLKYEELKKLKMQQQLISLGANIYDENENDREAEFMKNEIASLKNKINHINDMLVSNYDTGEKNGASFTEKNEMDEFLAMAESMVKQENVKLKNKSEKIEQALVALKEKDWNLSNEGVKSKEYKAKVSQFNKLLEVEKKLHSDLEHFKSQKERLQSDIRELSEDTKITEDKLLEEKHEYIYLLRSKQKLFNELSSKHQKILGDLRVHPYHKDIQILESKLADLMRENYSITEFVSMCIKEKDVQCLNDNVVQKVNQINGELVKLYK